ncbi:chromosomal replication initiator protein DnaA [Singulisphaera sp. GP187]|uniref:chromosomal replication initiator protein DnaA n=2 Tax=Singulisphaera TaxID=466152 RepID=UPI0009269E30|nr:chromosomal replication initiator protein DnaA [Singulisphaera sp. GP187]SIO33072.1 chromosomal replication initiator protein DnaA [Singulisphaera sp. GP187]
MVGHHGDVESTLRTAVAERLGEGRFGLWFGEGVRLGVADDALEVGVPNAFFREWIQGHFATNLIEAAEAVTGRTLKLTFRVADEAEPRVGNLIEPKPADERRKHGGTVPLAPEPQTPPQGERERPRNQARPARRLEDFVTGPCNRLAQAAAVEMVQTSGASFNPLVIHAGVGLGKTHLLEGIGHALRSRNPGLKLVQGTAEAFTNGFLDAMRAGNLGSFRSRYRRADALIIDDVHFLAAKRATQDEFLHTFNALIAEGVPIIVAADQHPRRIARLTDELATRFLGGMVVKLDAPSADTRAAILKAKALARGVDVPNAVIAYIAEHLRASVRELEGALHSLIAHAVLTGKRLDLALAKTALRDTIRHTAAAVGLRDVERAVCQLFEVDAETLKSNSRVRALSYPRMMAMYLARKHTGAAYSEIGRHFGGRNHSTVISAEKKVLGWLRDEERSALLAGFETVSDILAALERTLGT